MDRSRTAWEVMIFEGVTCYLQGNMTAAGQVVERLRVHHAVGPSVAVAAAAAQTGAPSDRVVAAQLSQQLWTTLLTLLATVHAADVAPAAAILEDARVLVRQTVNDESHWSELVHLQQMLWHALCAYVLHRQGRTDAAVTEAKEALQRLSFLAGNPLFAVSYVTFCLSANVLLDASAVLGASHGGSACSSGDDAHLFALILQSATDRFDRFARYVPTLAAAP